MPIRYGVKAVLIGLLSVAPALAATPNSPPVFQVDETTIIETQAALKSGQVTCHQLVEIYLKRIAAYDQTPMLIAGENAGSAEGHTARLNSIVTVNPEAMADADRLDHEYATTHKMGRLFGVVVIVKDNYDTRGLQTTGGSLALKWFVPDEDAFMVKRLREAGAIILAKSNMAEWAFSPVVTESSIAGITRNPYALDRVPAGSSGGTGASVAANFGEVGLGTDTGDSIRGPAAHNDLVGIRPTIGLVSRDGIIPLSSTNDVGGPLARTVADAAAILEVVQGYDPADPITRLSEGKSVASYSSSLDPNGLKGARIGVVRSYFATAKTDPQVAALTEKALAELKAQGAIVIDSFSLPAWSWEDADKVKCGGFEYDLNNYFKVHGQTSHYKSLQAVIDSGLYLGSIGERLKDAAQASHHEPLITTACLDTYHDPMKVHFRDAILREMDRQKLDALVYPTWSNPPRRVGDMKSPGGDNSQVICPMTGFPGITVPMGFTHGDLPAGLTFVGRSFSEASLIRLAYAYEQATHHRHAPAAFPALN